MKILYYTWDEAISKDVYNSLVDFGAQVDKLNFPITDKLNDLAFTEKLCSILDNKKYDCIYTTDFFPIISKIAYSYGIKYISWSYDSNPLVFYTNSIFNDTNYIFTYDFQDYLKFSQLGVKNIFHLPLAVNTKRLNAFLTNPPLEYNYDISFLGNLYNDEFNFYDQIKNISPYYRGYFDGIIRAQINLYGIDLAQTMITDDIYSNISQYINFNLDEELFISERELFVSFIQKKTTVLERSKLLSEISQKYNLTLFAPNTSKELPNVIFKGYADYYKQMPRIFNSSKINLNITLRSIITAIPLRCMDIMGAGGFLLSNYQPELAEFFENGTDMVMYDSHEDALNKIEYYLSHEKERIEIALNGKQKIEENYTYQIAYKKMFELCELK